MRRVRGASRLAPLLREVRDDGVVTPEESESLVRMMDALLAQDS